MCKIGAIVFSKPVEWNETLSKVVDSFHKTLCSSERDGFGFIIQSQAKSRYIERYVDPVDYIGIGKAFVERAKLGPMSNMVEGVFGRDGKVPKKVRAIILHGRTSTNEKNLPNTHPFCKKGWAIVHNGVVDFDAPKGWAYYSTCDSEHIVNVLANRGPKGLHDISGYMAIVGLNPHNDVIVGRCSTARLHVSSAAVCETPALVFGTTSDNITSMFKDINVVDYTSPKMIRDGKLVTLRGAKQIAVDDFDLRAASTYARSQQQRSLGFQTTSGTSSVTSKTTYPKYNVVNASDVVNA